MDINDLTLGQVQQLKEFFGGACSPSANSKPIASRMIGKQVIIRTYSAGVWFGKLSEKSGSEVIIKNARRLWKWWAKESISLSAVAIHGLNLDKSKVCEAVDSIWLDAIEIVPCTDIAIKSISEAKNVSAE